MIPIGLIIGGVALVINFEQFTWVSVAMLGPLAAFIGYILLTTKYSVEQNELTVQSGFLSKITIDIGTIRRISETRNPLSSPAASLDRIELVYNASNRVLLTPKGKVGFIGELTAINPAIDIVWRAKK